MKEVVTPSYPPQQNNFAAEDKQLKEEAEKAKNQLLDEINSFQTKDTF